MFKKTVISNNTTYFCIPKIKGANETKVAGLK